MKKICFFSVGFAFNRLVRMRFYEKIFPKDIEMFLFTTNKYKGREKEFYQHKWDLKRTKIITAKYHPLKLPFTLRKFCMENKIDRVINIGNWRGSVNSLIASSSSKTGYIMNIFGDIVDEEKSFILNSINMLLFYLLILASKKTIFNDYADYKKHKKLFRLFKQGNKIKYLPAPVNTNLFIPKDRQSCRKELFLPKNKKIILFVGRVDYGRGSDILIDLIKLNKDVLFIVIGRLMDKNFEKLKALNVIFFEKKSSEELVDYYNAADLGLFLHRKYRGGLGLVVEESLSCGIPAITPVRQLPKYSESLFQTPFPLNSNKINLFISKFFKMPAKKRKELGKIARKFAEENYSDDAWKDSYSHFYLD